VKVSTNVLEAGKGEGVRKEPERFDTGDEAAGRKGLRLVKRVSKKKKRKKR